MDGKPLCVCPELLCSGKHGRGCRAIPRTACKNSRPSLHVPSTSTLNELRYVRPKQGCDGGVRHACNSCVHTRVFASEFGHNCSFFCVHPCFFSLLGMRVCAPFVVLSGFCCPYNGALRISCSSHRQVRYNGVLKISCSSHSSALPDLVWPATVVSTCVTRGATVVSKAKKRSRNSYGCSVAGLVQ